MGKIWAPGQPECAHAPHQDKGKPVVAAVAGTGDTIHQGELIGTVGDTDGNTSGISAHLHFEFRDRGGGQGYPGYVRPVSFHGNPFDYSKGTETFVSQNCGTQAPPAMPGVSSVSRADGSIDVFATTSDHRVKHRNFSAGRWSCRATLPGNAKIKGDPAAVVSGNGTRIDVFAQGIDNRLKKLTWVAGQDWYDWADLGTYMITSSPAVIMRAGTSVDLLLRHYDSSLIQWYSPDGADHTTYRPQDFGGYITTSPTAVTWGSRRMDVFSRNSNGDLIQKFWTAGNDWTPYIGLGPVGAPAC